MKPTKAQTVALNRIRDFSNSDFFTQFPKGADSKMLRRMTAAGWIVFDADTQGFKPTEPAKTLKPGVQFRHNIWLENDIATPMLCLVTCVRKGIVYWRPVNGKRAKDYFPLLRSEWHVKEIL